MVIDWKKEANETDKLTSELQRRGIELPKDPLLWFDDLEEQSARSKKSKQATEHI